MPTYTFSKSARLLKAPLFQDVFEKNTLRVSSKEILILARPNKLRPRLGLVVGKKNISLAVNRNRFKRCARESFRLQQHSLPSLDIIVLARRGAGDLTTKKLQEKLLFLWLELQKKQAANFL